MLVQSSLSTLSFGSRCSRDTDTDDAGAAEELERGYYNDEDDHAWFEERDEDEEIKQEDESMTLRSTNMDDVQRAVVSNV